MILDFAALHGKLRDEAFRNLQDTGHCLAPFFGRVTKANSMKDFFCAGKGVGITAVAKFQDECSPGDVIAVDAYAHHARTALGMLVDDMEKAGATTDQITAWAGGVIFGLKGTPLFELLNR